MNSRHKTSLILFGIIFLSGCTTIPGFGPSGGGNGVVISNLVATPSPADPGVPIVLQLTLKNQGSETAGNVIADLLGLTNEWGISPSKTVGVGNLYGEQKSTQGATIPGQETDVVWTLVGPAKTVEFPYPIKVRVLYTYSTSGDGQIRAVSTDYLRQSGDKGGSNFVSTSSPIKVSMAVDSSVFSVARVPVMFTFTNAGGGRVFSGTSPSGQSLDQIFISTSGVYCPANVVRLTNNGQSGVARCYIDTGGVASFANFPVSITSTYSYFVDKDVTITVRPNPVYGGVLS